MWPSNIGQKDLFSRTRLQQVQCKSATTATVICCTPLTSFPSRATREHSFVTPCVSTIPCIIIIIFFLLQTVPFSLICRLTQIDTLFRKLRVKRDVSRPGTSPVLCDIYSNYIVNSVNESSPHWQYCYWRAACIITLRSGIYMYILLIHSPTIPCPGKSFCQSFLSLFL